MKSAGTRCVNAQGQVNLSLEDLILAPILKHRESASQN
jgi:hypothetical protein